MSTPAKLNYKIIQGSTFNEVLRWESSQKVYTPITSITKAAPAVITAAGHGAPPGWRVKFTSIKGMTDLNSSDNYWEATTVTTNTLSPNALNTIDFKDYISGGVVEYNKPVDMSGYTARMQIRASVDSDTIILELTTQNGGIILDNTNKTITLNIPATTTAGFSFSTAVYSLELVSSGGQVTTLINGGLTLIKEVTR